MPLGSVGTTLLAHGGEEHTEATGWAVHPVPLVTIIVAGVGYTMLMIMAHRRGQPVSVARGCTFALGLAVAGIAMMSPLDAFGESRSVAAHMLQHELLLTVVPLLLVAGVDRRLTLPITRRVFRPAVKRRSWHGVLHAISNPWVVTSAWVLVALGWHVPGVYALALRDPTVHIVQHSSLLTVGLLFWLVVLDRVPAIHRTTAAQRCAALGIAMAAGGVLGAVLMLAPGLVYPWYSDAVPWFGLTPMADQRFAGVIMMVIDMPVMLGALLLVAGRWARQQARSGLAPQTEQTEQTEQPEQPEQTEQTLQSKQPARRSVDA